MRASVIYGTYAFMNIAILFMIDHWLCRSSNNYRENVGLRVIVSFLYIAFAFVPVLATMIRENVYQYMLIRYSNIWMGVLMYLGGMLLIATVAEIMCRLAARAGARRRELAGEPYTPEEASKRDGRARVLSGLVFFMIIAVSVGLNVYGMIHARETVVTQYDIKIDKHVKTAGSLRAAVISDLHISYNSDVEMIQNMVDKVNFYKPDVVFVTGDIFSSNYSSVREPKKYIKALKRLKAKEGVYWVYGNHDVEEPLFMGLGMAEPEDAVRTKKMVKFLQRSRFQILEDSRTAILGGEVQLVGRADKYRPCDKAEKRLSADELLNDLDREKPIIVLEHEPGDYKSLAENGADLAFSGHTHAGQIFPVNIAVSMFNDMTYGIETKEGMQAVVTSGAGTYGPPVRIGTDSEIVIADISFRKS